LVNNTPDTANKIKTIIVAFPFLPKGEKNLISTPDPFPLPEWKNTPGVEKQGWKNRGGEIR